MKTLFLLMSLTLSLTSFAADTKTDTAAMDPKKAEMMKAWMAYATPGAEHKTISAMVGRWTYTSKYWESATAAPMESKGTSNIKMIFGGRYIQQDVKGKAMGMPFEGMALLGYDNIKKKYESIWIDNMGTGVMHGTATFDAATQTLTETGEMTCPMKKDGKTTTTFRMETKLVDKNNMVMKMFSPSLEDGKEMLNMEMIYKRVK